MKIEGRAAWTNRVFIDLYIDYQGQTYYWQATLELNLNTWDIRSEDEDLMPDDPLYILIDTYARSYLAKNDNAMLKTLLGDIEYVS